jgi:probable rRNA maturation factor
MSASPGIEVVFRRSGVRAGRGRLEAFTREVLALALREVRRPGAGVSVLYCSDAEIRRLNRDFRGIDSPTDVLSFPSGDAASPYLGDLAIALPYTERHAAASGRRLDDEIALLLVHGTLHLLGWDHATASQEARMWKRQDGIVERLRRERGGVVEIAGLRLG